MKQLARNANALATSAQLPAVAEEEVPLWLVLYLNLAADWQAANPEPDEWDEEDAYEAYNDPRAWQRRRDRWEAEARRIVDRLPPGPKGIVLHDGRWEIVLVGKSAPTLPGGHK